MHAYAFKSCISLQPEQFIKTHVKPSVFHNHRSISRHRIFSMLRHLIVIITLPVRTLLHACSPSDFRDIYECTDNSSDYSIHHSWLRFADLLFKAICQQVLAVFARSKRHFYVSIIRLQLLRSRIFILKMI
jgi:hypothetical protein